MVGGFPTASPNDADSRARGPMVANADPADWLPREASVERYHVIKQRVADCHSLLTPSEQMRDLHLAKSEIEARIAELQKPRGVGGFNLDDDAPQVIAERRKLDRATAELKRAKELDEIRDARWRAAGNVASNVDMFLRSVPSDSEQLVPVEDVDVASVLKKNETIGDAIERLQRRVREWKADLHRVRSAPLPSAVARELASAQIDRLAAAGEPYTAGVVEHGQEVIFASTLLNAVVRNVDSRGAVAQAEPPNAVGLVAWLLRDELKAKICAAIDADSDDSAALTAEQRKDQERQINEDMLTVERQEVALIFKAQRDGAAIEFRPDTSPLALLGLAFGPRQPKPPAFERSSLPSRR